MAFLEPFGPEINPLTGYPFREQNLDERISKILDDDSDETPAVPQPSVQQTKTDDTVSLNLPTDPVKKSSANYGKETKDECPSSIQSNTKNKCQIQPTKMDDTALSNRSKDAIKESHVLPTKDMKNKRPVAPSSSSAKDRYEIIKIQPTKTDSASLNRSNNAVKESQVLPNKDTKNKSLTSPSSIQNNTKDKHQIQPTKMDTFSLNSSVDSAKKSSMLSDKETKDDLPIIPPPAKKIKLECKHSFNFIRANTADMVGNGTKSEKKRHRAIFRHFEDWMKIDERKKAYKKLSDITKIVWPNPRDVTTDEKVTALNINEFKKDDIYRMMVDLALNDPNLFEVHELIYAKNLKPSERKQ